MCLIRIFNNLLNIFCFELIDFILKHEQNKIIINFQIFNFIFVFLSKCFFVLVCKFVNISLLETTTDLHLDVLLLFLLLKKLLFFNSLKFYL